MLQLTPSPIPSISPPQNLEILLIYYISRFLDHMTILFMLLQTWYRIVIEVMVN